MAKFPEPLETLISRKYSKAQVQYENIATMNHHCKDCIHFESPDQCEIVKGKINPQGWCKKWSKK